MENDENRKYLYFVHHELNNWFHLFRKVIDETGFKISAQKN